MTDRLIRVTTALAVLMVASVAAIMAVRDLHAAGHSQRSIARDLNLGRRKVKQIIDREAA